MDDGKRSASELFKVWAGFVARILLRTGVPASDLDDAVQEVFLVAHRRGGFVPCGASEKTWLAEIALRVASNVRRSRRRRPTVHDDVAMAMLESGGPDPHVSTELRERLARVGEALETIPAEPRLVFVLIELSGMSADEVAKERGVPVGTVYSRLHTAKKAFRASYERALERGPKRSLLGSLRDRLSLSLPSAPPKKELAR